MNSLRIEVAALGLLTCLACSGDDDGGLDDAGPPEDGEVTPTDMPIDMTTEPDLGPPENCTEEGAMRPAPCGNCGMTQERCEGGFWIAGECLAEGECAPGALEERSFAMCGTEARLCTEECAWLEWTTTTEPLGECTPMEERRDRGACGAGEIQDQVCSDGCEWVAAGPCESECGALRASPMDAEEVCVPSGLFIRGDDQDPTSPRAEVFVSAFAIDRFPVTNRRFLECRMDGGCPYFIGNEGHLTDPEKADWMVLGAFRQAAIEFCTWDGGRRLPTEAEWEKAMRGPSPRMNIYPWGDTMDCTRAPFLEGCPEESDPIHESSYRPIHQYPGQRSFYGLDDTVGNGGQLVSDFYDPDYFSDPMSLVDPQGPASGGRTIKQYTGTLWEGHRISERRDMSVSMQGPSFRCARDGE